MLLIPSATDRPLSGHPAVSHSSVAATPVGAISGRIPEALSRLKHVRALRALRVPPNFLSSAFGRTVSCNHLCQEHIQKVNVSLVIKQIRASDCLPHRSYHHYSILYSGRSLRLPITISLTNSASASATALADPLRCISQLQDTEPNKSYRPSSRTSATMSESHWVDWNKNTQSKDYRGSGSFSTFIIIGRMFANFLPLLPICCCPSPSMIVMALQFRPTTL